MSKTLRNFLFAFTFFAVVLFFIFFKSAVFKPATDWKWIDILSESGCVAFCIAWGVLILSVRPRGRVSTLLAIGLCAIALGFLVDSFDEFILIDKSRTWDNWFESGLILGGMMVFSVGLYLLREEQLFLKEHLQKRERLFREHRSFDLITQIGNADYLRKQLEMENRRVPSAPCTLIMFELCDFQNVLREYGWTESDRVLQAVTQLLLLNLRTQDLICRYAGERFTILLPETHEWEAKLMAAHLERVTSQLAHHTQRGNHCLQLRARSIYASCTKENLDSILSALNAALSEKSGFEVLQPSV